MKSRQNQIPLGRLVEMSAKCLSQPIISALNLSPSQSTTLYEALGTHGISFIFSGGMFCQTHCCVRITPACVTKSYGFAGIFGGYAQNFVKGALLHLEHALAAGAVRKAYVRQPKGIVFRIKLHELFGAFFLPLAAVDFAQRIIDNHRQSEGVGNGPVRFGALF